MYAQVIYKDYFVRADILRRTDKTGMDCRIRVCNKETSMLGGKEIRLLSCLESAPEIFFIHCGGNDLGYVKLQVLRCRIKRRIF